MDQYVFEKNIPFNFIRYLSRIKLARLNWSTSCKPALK